MKLSKSNPFLRSAAQARSALWLSAKTSSAVEGIRQPFAEGSNAWRPATVQALIDHWKKRSSRSGR